jgi:hypothetical protein
MLSITYKTFMLSVIMMNDIMLSVIMRIVIMLSVFELSVALIVTQVKERRYFQIIG